MSTGGMRRGDLVDVMTHHLPGKEWTIGQVGAVMGPTHTEFIDHRHLTPEQRKKVKMPPIKKGWWNCSVEHKVARGGYAYVSLPEMYLGPHACTDICPTPHIL